MSVSCLRRLLEYSGEIRVSAAQPVERLRATLCSQIRKQGVSCRVAEDDTLFFTTNWINPNIGMSYPFRGAPRGRIRFERDATDQLVLHYECDYYKLLKVTVLMVLFLELGAILAGVLDSPAPAFVLIWVPFMMLVGLTLNVNLAIANLAAFLRRFCREQSLLVAEDASTG